MRKRSQPTVKDHGAKASSPFVQFLADNKIWWLLPMVLVILLLLGLALVSASGQLPYMYQGL